MHLVKLVLWPQKKLHTKSCRKLCKCLIVSWHTHKKNDHHFNPKMMSFLIEKKTYQFWKVMTREKNQFFHSNWRTFQNKKNHFYQKKPTNHSQVTCSMFPPITILHWLLVVNTRLIFVSWILGFSCDPCLKTYLFFKLK